MIKPFGKHNVYYLDVNYLNQSSIVYSCGIGDDFTFDLELGQYLGRPTYAFDLTPQSLKKYSILYNLHKPIFYNFGISDIDGEEKFNILKEFDNYMAASNLMLGNKCGRGEEDFVTFHVRTIPSIMKELKHSHIDVLRMDIEGAEFKVFPTLFDLKIYPTQISVEIHNIDDKFNLEFALNLLETNGYKMIWNSEEYKECTFIRSFLVDDI